MEQTLPSMWLLQRVRITACATNYGTGEITVTSTGNVKGGTIGIFGSNFSSTVYGSYYGSGISDGTDMTITSDDVSGGLAGIAVIGGGTGEVSVTATGTVTGGRAGVYVGTSTGNSSGTGTDVTSDYFGIIADHHGSGAVTITSTGAVTGGDRLASYGYGQSSVSGGGYTKIYANGTGTDLVITAVDVSGGDTGIAANNSGTGALTITTTGSVSGGNGVGQTSSGTSGYGLYAPSYDGITATNDGTDLTISVADVSGAEDGATSTSYAYRAELGKRIAIEPVQRCGGRQHRVHQRQL